METKIKRKGFQFRFSPNGEQQRQFARIAGACRFVYNKALAERIRVYKEVEKSSSFFTTSYWLAEGDFLNLKRNLILFKSGFHFLVTSKLNRETRELNYPCGQGLGVLPRINNQDGCDIENPRRLLAKQKT